MCLLRPLAHAVVTRPVRVHVGDGAGGARLRALGIAAAEITLHDLAAVLVVVDGAEGARDGAHLAADADVVRDFLCAGHHVQRDRLHRARVQAPGLGALGAGVGDRGAAVLEFEYLDARLRRVEYPLVLERARHLALQAARAFLGVDEE